jgi:hypothetical protein
MWQDDNMTKALFFIISPSRNDKTVRGKSSPAFPFSGEYLSKPARFRLRSVSPASAGLSEENPGG